jgi:hypothetical protein
MGTIFFTRHGKNSPAGLNPFRSSSNSEKKNSSGHWAAAPKASESDTTGTSLAGAAPVPTYSGKVCIVIFQDVHTIVGPGLIYLSITSNIFVITEAKSSG